MRSKKTLILATIIFTLTSAVNADLILTLNGLDSAKESVEIDGTSNLVIAVGGSTEVEASDYSIEADGGIIEAISEDETSSQQGREYLFSFGDESGISIVKLTASAEMVIDGTSVEDGDIIYTLAIVNVPKMDTVKAVGRNLEDLRRVRLEAEIEVEAAPAVEARPRPFMSLAEGQTKKLHKLRYFPKAVEGTGFEGLMFEEMGAGMENLLDEVIMAASQGGGEGNDVNYPPGFIDDRGEYTVIPADTHITTNTVWDSDVNLMGAVYVEDAMLIIKPGVTVKMSHSGGGSIVVRENGCIIANGTPDNMINFIPSGTATPCSGYPCAIKLEENVSPLCEISYCLIFWAYIGIWNQNNRLENPFHDNSIWECWFCILQEGPMLTDVKNNEIVFRFNLYYDLYDPLTMTIPRGITIQLSDADGTATNATEIYIENNTIVGQNVGIYIEGVEDPNEAGRVTLANNLMTVNNRYGIYLTGGWMDLHMACNGFYSNGENVYVPTRREFDSNSVVVVENFNSYEGTADLRGTWDCFYFNETAALVHPHPGSENPFLVRDGNSMEYTYDNNLAPYYSESRAYTIDLGVEPNWLSPDTNTLALYFIGRTSNDAGEQMYVELADDDEGPFYIIDNFDSYLNANELRTKWFYNYTAAFISLRFGQYYPLLDRDGNFMWYEYNNDDEPYYSEVDADIADLEIDPNWVGMGAKALSLYFYGQANNDANEDMYIKLTDNNQHTTKLFYSGDMNDIREEKWHAWDIVIEDFVDGNDVNLADVKRITIGFGDGNGRGDGIVYFDDVRLCLEYPYKKQVERVVYDSPYHIMEQRWHVWNINLSELTDVNAGNIKRITIGFGDGNNPYPNEGTGTVYFDDIMLGNGKFPEPQDPYDDSPIFLKSNPFVNGTIGYPYFLKQNCPLIEAGYGYIDEYPELIGKTTSVDGAPDSGILDIGLHYPNWYFEELGSDEPLPADIDNSMTVDFKDFAVLADYWLQSTSGEADIDGSGLVDYNDLVLFAEEWQCSNGIYLELLNLDETSQLIDFNNISGYVGVVLRNIPFNVGTVFTYIDDVQIGRWTHGWNSENELFGFESDKFSNGWHTIRLVSITDNGVPINYQPMNVFFSNLLYKISAGDQFYPDENYCYTGFYDGENSIDVNITGLYGSVIWSNTYSGSFIDINVPGSAFVGEQFCDLRITDTFRESMASRKSLTKKFKKEDCTGVRMLIITPTKDVFNRRKPALQACAKACEDLQVPWISLHLYDVNKGNITYAYNHDSVKYIYWAGHASSHVSEVQRTHTDCWLKGEMGWSPTYTVYVNRGAFSWTRQTKDDAPLLPDNWDNKGFDLWSLGMHDSGNKKIVFVDGCLSAKHNDLASAYGMYSTWNGGHYDQIYIGWRIEVYSVPWWHPIKPVMFYTDGVKLFWEKMGDGYTVYNALHYTSCSSGGIKKALWGPNGELELHEPYDESDDNIWIYGTGIHNKLEP